MRNPGENVAPIKYEKKIREPLTDTEMEALRSVCDTPYEKAVVETLYSTGCRVSELINIRIKDIDFETREVHVYGKGKKAQDHISEREISSLHQIDARCKILSFRVFVRE